MKNFLYIYGLTFFLSSCFSTHTLPVEMDLNDTTQVITFLVNDMERHPTNWYKDHESFYITLPSVDWLEPIRGHELVLFIEPVIEKYHVVYDEQGNANYNYLPANAICLHNKVFCWDGEYPVTDKTIHILEGHNLIDRTDELETFVCDNRKPKNYKKYRIFKLTRTFKKGGKYK